MINMASQQVTPSPSPIRAGEGGVRRNREKTPGDGCSPSPALADSNLILIGTVHGDPRGYDRVWRLLTRFRPEVVTVEISRFSLRYRQAWESRWRRRFQKALAALPAAAAVHPAIQRVAAQIALPFEYRAARDYSRQYGRTCLPLDLGSLSRRHLPRYDRELLAPANLRALAGEPREDLEDWVNREFHRAHLAFTRLPWRLALDDNAQTLRRERFWATRLQRLVRQSSRIVHLGGWEHLVPWRQGEGLRAWLAAANPAILLADEADALPGSD